MAEGSSRAAYRIETERLLLRCWSPEDAPAVRDSLDTSDAHLRPWIPFMKHEPQSLDGTVEWLRWRREQFAADKDYCYGVFGRADGVLVGEVMLLGRAGPGALELGYWIDVRRIGRGFATEACAALVAVGFEVHRVARLEATCAVGNELSIQLARRLGFLEEDGPTPPHADADAEALVRLTLPAAAYPDSLASRAEFQAFDAHGAPRLAR